MRKCKDCSAQIQPRPGRGRPRERCDTCWAENRRRIDRDKKRRRYHRDPDYRERQLERLGEIPPCPEARRKRRILARYNLTPEQYDEMVLKQDGKCAICGRKPDYPLHVDHDHESGRVRGLLCMTCNQGLGKLGDSLSGLLRAVEYLSAPPI